MQIISIDESLKHLHTSIRVPSGESNEAPAFNLSVRIDQQDLQVLIKVQQPMSVQLHFEHKQGGALKQHKPASQRDGSKLYDRTLAAKRDAGIEVQ